MSYFVILPNDLVEHGLLENDLDKRAVQLHDLVHGQFKQIPCIKYTVYVNALAANTEKNALGTWVLFECLDVSRNHFDHSLVCGPVVLFGVSKYRNERGLNDHEMESLTDICNKIADLKDGLSSSVPDMSSSDDEYLR